MSDPAALRRWSQTDWPSDHFTLEENWTDLDRHEREHGDRVAFTFTVLDPKENRCLGCVYFSPLKPEAEELRADARYPVWAAFWVRESEVASELDRHLLTAMLEWLGSGVGVRPRRFHDQPQGLATARPAGRGRIRARQVPHAHRWARVLDLLPIAAPAGTCLLDW